MRILITGGAGFIGSHLVRQLLNDRFHGFGDADVTVIDKLTYAGNQANLPEAHPRLTFVRGDVRDRALLADVVPGHDCVVHCAAESHVDRSTLDADDFITTNVVGTQRLLDACRAGRVSRILHVSTDEVYGSIAEGSWTEERPLQPNSPYAASKAASDLVALAYARTHGLDLSITRCSNNYGPRQYPEKLIPLFATNLLSGLPVPLYGDGSNVREWLHVSDHCQALMLALRSGRPGRVYNVGGGTERTNLEIATELARLCGARPELITRVPDRKGHDFRYSLDDSRIRSELGYAPQVPFEAGLAATVDWYRAHQAWWGPVRAAR